MDVASATAKIFGPCLRLALLCCTCSCTEPQKPEPVIALRHNVEVEHASAAPGDQQPSVSAITERPLPTWSMPGMAPLVENAIAEGKLLGCVIAVGDPHGIRYLHAFGKRSVRPAEEAMTTDTVFDLASLTKPIVVGTLMAQLADEGKLSVTDRVAKHLPGFSGSDRADITIADLLLHTSGLPSVTPLSDFEQPSNIARQRLLHSPLSEPRGQFNYSDIGYMLLGELIAQVTGTSLDAYAQSHIFEPLGMQDTRYGPLPSALRSRTAPTEDRDEVMIRGDVHDPRAYRLGGVAGNAGLFSTAQDLSLYARTLLHGGTLNTTQLLTPTAHAAFTQKHAAGHAVRTLGWDVLSGYSRLRGHALSAEAYGHGGFTGTSLWVDPGRHLFVVFLSHRVHPDGQGDVLKLVGQITDEAVRNSNPELSPACARVAGHTQTGIDQLLRSEFSPLAGRHVGLIVNGASRAASGATTLSLFRSAHTLTLQAVMTPEHGLDVNQEGAIADLHATDGNPPIYSLFGKHRRPTDAMLHNVDTLVFDLQDAGVRFFTYMSTLREALFAAKEHNIPIWVLDRPNPLGADIVEGPTLDPSVRTFVHYHNLPIRHGMTAGELARLLNEELRIGADLHVQWMDGYYRELLWSDTGVPFVPPSPNLRSESAALLYPAVALLESTRISVGRGTDTPFEVVGAPFVDGRALADRLSQRPLSGISVEAVDFSPQAPPYAGLLCHGVRLRVTHPRSYRAVDTGLHLASVLAELYGTRMSAFRLQNMVGHTATTQAVLSGRTLLPAATDIFGVEEFLKRRQHFLHYPTCDP